MQAALIDLRFTANIDAVGVAVLLDMMHPVDVGLELRVDSGYTSRADELQHVTKK